MRHSMFSPLELSQAFAQACSHGLMNSVQYFRVVAEMLTRGPCNMLIFGAGADTQLYLCANATGKTLVVEDHPQWTDRTNQVHHCDLLTVKYTTKLGDGWSENCSLPEGLPEDLLRIGWDVILVDGPEGYRGDKPGRQQSLFAASLARRAGSTIFVHDHEREMEQRAATHYLGTPVEMIGQRPSLAVFQTPFPRACTQQNELSSS